MAGRQLEGVRPELAALAASLGDTLVDVELVKEGPGRYLRMYLDRPGGVSLDDCEAFHRRAQALVENLEYDFLEVSSPGLDRPLKTDADFQAALGEEIVVRLYRAQHGVKEYTGFLAAAQAEEIALNTAAGEIHFPRKAVALAKRLVRLEALGLE